MDTQLKTQASFTLSASLIKDLKAKAAAHNTPLNDYVESLLLDSIYFTPNETTLAAMAEVESGKELEKLDMAHFREYVDAL